MDAARRALAKRIFEEALERPAEERAAHVREASGVDTRLRAEVESLLTAHILAAGCAEGPSGVAMDVGPEPAALGPRLAPGTHLGRYRITDYLGEGGMAQVYQARDTKLPRDVAIKVISPKIRNDPYLRARFEREAQAVAALNHEHIVTVHDVGEAGGTLYIVFELIRGETLKQRLARGALAVSEALDFARQLLKGLTHAHEAGVLHRDLKPGNVMVSPQGRVKILDFGLGKFLGPGERANETATITAISLDGGVMGTPGYMAPEQALGEAVDARADQFAFGVLLYEMLTGTRALRPGATIDDDPPPLTFRIPTLPLALQDVVLRCLAKRPEARYATTRAVLDEVEAIAARLSTPAAGRTRRFVIGLGVATLILVMATFWQGLMTRRSVAPPVLQTATLAFLPIQIRDADESDRAYWAGLTEAVAMRLDTVANSHNLHVTPPADVRAREVRTPEDARLEFGASQVLRGDAWRDGDRLRARLELVDTVSNRVTRSRDVTAPQADRGALQARVLEAVLGLLDVTPSSNERGQISLSSSMAGADDFYLQGLGYLQDDSRPATVDAAVSVFEHAISLDPKYASAYAGLGEAYWRKYQFTSDKKWVDMARQTCERALGVDERASAPHRCLGTVANGVGDYEKAVEEYQHALDREPGSELARIGLANAYDRLRQPALAEAAYLEAIRLRPRYWNGYSRLGAFYYAQRRYPDAEKMFRQVVALNPDSWRGYSNLGALLYVQQRPKDAIAAYERSLAIRPNYQAASNLGTLYFYELKDYRKAAGVFGEAVKINDGEYVVWGNFAAALLWSGQGAEARSAYTRASTLAEQRLAVNPRDAHVTMSLAEYGAALGQMDRARRLLEKALTLEPNDARLLFQAGVLYEHRLHEREKALELLGRALSAGYPWIELERSPALGSLRAGPRLDQLRRRATPLVEAAKGGA